MMVGTIEYVASNSELPTWMIRSFTSSRTNRASPIVKPQAALSWPKMGLKISGSVTLVRYGIAAME